MTSYNHKSRNDLYTLLAVGKKQLGWDEDKYRLFLQTHGAQQHSGKYSAASMNTSDIIAIEAMKAAGFVPTRKAGKKPDWREPRIRKITALWCALADAGEVRERGYTSMERWCRYFRRYENSR